MPPSPLSRETRASLFPLLGILSPSSSPSSIARTMPCSRFGGARPPSRPPFSSSHSFKSRAVVGPCRAMADGVELPPSFDGSAARRRANAGSAHTPRRQSPVVAGSERPPLVIVARYEDCAITPVIPAASTALLLRSPCCGLRPPRCFDRPTASIARRLRPPSCFDHPAASTCPASTALRLRSPAASIAVRL